MIGRFQKIQWLPLFLRGGKKALSGLEGSSESIQERAGPGNLTGRTGTEGAGTGKAKQSIPAKSYSSEDIFMGRESSVRENFLDSIGGLESGRIAAEVESAEGKEGSGLTGGGERSKTWSGDKKVSSREEGRSAEFSGKRKGSYPAGDSGEKSSGRLKSRGVVNHALKADQTKEKASGKPVHTRMSLGDSAGSGSIRGEPLSTNRGMRSKSVLKDKLIMPEVMKTSEQLTDLDELPAGQRTETIDFLKNILPRLGIAQKSAQFISSERGETVLTEMPAKRGTLSNLGGLEHNSEKTNKNAVLGDSAASDLNAGRENRDVSDVSRIKSDLMVLQSEFGFKADGVLNRETLQFLQEMQHPVSNPAEFPILERHPLKQEISGDAGVEVKDSRFGPVLKNFVGQLLMEGGTAGGTDGDLSVLLRQFQRSEGLESNGRLNRATLQALTGRVLQKSADKNAAGPATSGRGLNTENRFVSREGTGKRARATEFSGFKPDARSGKPERFFSPAFVDSIRDELGRSVEGKNFISRMYGAFDEVSIKSFLNDFSHIIGKKGTPAQALQITKEANVLFPPEIMKALDLNDFAGAVSRTWHGMKLTEIRDELLPIDGHRIALLAKEAGIESGFEGDARGIRLFKKLTGLKPDALLNKDVLSLLGKMRHAGLNLNDLNGLLTGGDAKTNRSLIEAMYRGGGKIADSTVNLFMNKFSQAAKIRKLSSQQIDAVQADTPVDLKTGSDFNIQGFLKTVQKSFGMPQHGILDLQTMRAVEGLLRNTPDGVMIDELGASLLSFESGLARKVPFSKYDDRSLKFSEKIMGDILARMGLSVMDGGKRTAEWLSSAVTAVQEDLGLEFSDGILDMKTFGILQKIRRAPISRMVFSNVLFDLTGREKFDLIDRLPVNPQNLKSYLSKTPAAARIIEQHAALPAVLFRAVAKSVEGNQASGMTEPVLGFAGRKSIQNIFSGMSPDEIKTVLMTYQSFKGLKQTGMLDVATLEKMALDIQEDSQAVGLIKQGVWFDPRGHALRERLYGIIPAGTLPASSSPAMTSPTEAPKIRINQEAGYPVTDADKAGLIELSKDFIYSLTRRLKPVDAQAMNAANASPDFDDPAVMPLPPDTVFSDLAPAGYFSESEASKVRESNQRDFKFREGDKSQRKVNDSDFDKGYRKTGDTPGLPGQYSVHTVPVADGAKLTIFGRGAESASEPRLQAALATEGEFEEPGISFNMKNYPRSLPEPVVRRFAPGGFMLFDGIPYPALILAARFNPAENIIYLSYLHSVSSFTQAPDHKEKINLPGGFGALVTAKLEIPIAQTRIKPAEGSTEDGSREQGGSDGRDQNDGQKRRG